MEMNIQTQAPASFLGQEAGWFAEPDWKRWRIEKYLTCRESVSGSSLRPVCNLVTKPTMLVIFLQLRVIKHLFTLCSRDLKFLVKTVFSLTGFVVE